MSHLCKKSIRCPKVRAKNGHLIVNTDLVRRPHRRGPDAAVLRSLPCVRSALPLPLHQSVVAMGLAPHRAGTPHRSIGYRSLVLLLRESGIRFCARCAPLDKAGLWANPAR